MSTFTRIPFTGQVSRRNLAINPQAGIDTTGYTGAVTGGSVSVTRGAGGPAEVASRPAVTVTASGSAGAIQIAYTVAGIVPGDVYTVTAYCLADGGTSGETRVSWLDGSANIIRTDTGLEATPTVWQRFVMGGAPELVAPAGAVSVRVMYRANYPGTIPVGQRVFMTGILIEPGVFSVGTEHRRNLCPNPSFEVDMTGWTTAGAASSFTRFTSLPMFGAARAAITAGSAAASYGAYTASNRPVVVPGNTYTLSAYLMSGGVARIGRLLIRWMDAGGAQVAQSAADTPSAVSTSVYERASVTAVAPAGAATAQLWVGFYAQAADEAFRVDGVLFEKSPVLGPYFDGATPDPDVLSRYEWTGTANASASVYETRERLADAVRPYFDGDTPSTTLELYEWTGTAHASISRLMTPNPATDQVAPLKVVAPYTAGYEARTIRHQLMQSETVRVTFVPVTPGEGVFDLLFASPAAAKAAVPFFKQRREFYLDTPGLPEVGTRFVVAGGSLELTQDDELPEQLWHVLVPWQEYPL